MDKPLTVDRIGLVLGSLLALACDKQPQATAEPAASTAVSTTPVPATSAVSAKEVPPSAGASAAPTASGAAEKKCAAGGCAPGKCS
ncbi:MAG: hypothetical protein R3B13_35020 [Polyangiaceae bacterium]